MLVITIIINKECHEKSWKWGATFVRISYLKQEQLIQMEIPYDQLDIGD